MSRPDMDDLLQEGLDAAAHLLEKSGEFFPFAVVKSAKKEIVHVQAITSEAMPKSDDVIILLIQYIKTLPAYQGAYTVGIVSDVKLENRKTGKFNDAIRMQIDDRRENPVICYVNYEIKSGVVELGEVVAAKGKRFVFLP